MPSRREFLGNAATAAAGLAIAANAKSYAQIAGANERVHFAVIGLNSRAYAHLSSLKANKADARIIGVADVDTVILDRFAGRTATAMGDAPRKEQDFRKLLASKDVDVITIATPDHWHAPMAILGLQAGKHVYVEKPCSHNPQEGEWLVAAQKKTGKLCQMGSQQRSHKATQEIVAKIKSGAIGKPYWGETWYANTRKPIGVGKPIPVPATLDWDLWQGPAPREAYRDNVHPYNWHWFKTWGTGESLNNGTHEVDVARWALGVEYPNKVTAAGGRYATHDDWQFYDTLDTSFEYPDALITWKGSCISGKKTYGRDRGTAIHGTEATAVIDRGGWEIYDQKDKVIDSYKQPAHAATSSADTVGADSMTDAHFANLIAAIRTGEKLNQPIAQGNVSTTLVQLSNIAYFSQAVLTLNPENGHVTGNKQAEGMWGRNYQKGWEPKV
ncbi:Gfo/Idh/MocA family protein [Terriglobus aquaticus]|uniref:Gfo/Idh/MocA family protein n=1 Tax=Terriglobus aquaticus TaxID=940139 RepID=A0ABW9KNW2_9BACT|nr:Gfo/Idh/MocA family oxidoreductase [Terriglobus aquaticus]